MAARGAFRAKKQMETDREYFESCIEEMEEGVYGRKEMPPPDIVKYHDLVEKLWGWDRILPHDGPVSMSVYNAYLVAYYNHSAAADTMGSRIAAASETCLTKEKQLVSEWKACMQSKMEMTLSINKSIILSCLINQCATSIQQTAGCESSALSAAALWCIAKEAELTYELLRRGANPQDELIDQSSGIRMCALSLMNCGLHNSIAASGLMLGMSKEAEIMREWMSENNMRLDICSHQLTDVIAESFILRTETLAFMIDMLRGSPAAASGGHKVHGAEDTTRGSVSDEFNSQHSKIVEGKESKKRKADVFNSQYSKIKKGKESKKRKADNREDLFGKLCKWERLLPFYEFVEWSNYSDYLEKYYNQNTINFIGDTAAFGKCCLKMEEELMLEWKAHVQCLPDYTFTSSHIIHSSLMKDHALQICSTGGEFSVFSAVAFACITMEGGLICELLKHGANPNDDIIEQSNVIRMCALGLMNLKRHPPITSAAAMMGAANEAKMLCDWIRRNNKVLTFSLFEPRNLEGYLMRIRTLDVMTRILLESSFPSSDQALWSRGKPCQYKSKISDKQEQFK